MTTSSEKVSDTQWKLQPTSVFLYFIEQTFRLPSDYAVHEIKQVLFSSWMLPAIYRGSGEQDSNFALLDLKGYAVEARVPGSPVQV